VVAIQVEDDDEGRSMARRAAIFFILSSLAPSTHTMIMHILSKVLNTSRLNISVQWKKGDCLLEQWVGEVQVLWPEQFVVASCAQVASLEILRSTNVPQPSTDHSTRIEVSMECVFLVCWSSGCRRTRR
jgi:hypothetical protein